MTARPRQYSRGVPRADARRVPARMCGSPDAWPTPTMSATTPGSHAAEMPGLRRRTAEPGDEAVVTGGQGARDPMGRGIDPACGVVTRYGRRGGEHRSAGRAVPGRRVLRRPRRHVKGTSPDREKTHSETRPWARNDVLNTRQGAAVRRSGKRRAVRDGGRRRTTCGMALPRRRSGGCPRRGLFRGQPRRRVWRIPHLLPDRHGMHHSAASREHSRRAIVVPGDPSMAQCFRVR